MKFRALIAAMALAALGLATFAGAADVELKNPGFETGNLRPWKKISPGQGNWSVYDAGDIVEPTRPRGLGGDPPPPPPRGNKAAWATQNGPGCNIIHRVFRLKPSKVNKLSFLLAYDNSNVFRSPNNFKFRGLDEGAPMRGMEVP